MNNIMKIEITDFISNEHVQDCPQKKMPEYAFIGRSNVGKSSLINSILNRKIARTSSKPGKTQLINHIIINNNWAVVDLPGYGYAKVSKVLKKKIAARTKNYFIKRGAPLAGVFILIDIRIPAQKNDLEWMEWLVENHIYFIRVFTKCDSISKNKIIENIKKYNEHMTINNWEKLPETIITSSVKNIGKMEMLNKIYEVNKLFQNI
tara:strand:+ start:458 stop:1075 length:618 start_codon:yes stop_codon:yes gene_type:complete